MIGRPAIAPELRIWKFIDDTGDCWLWTGTRSQRYGHFFNGKSRVPAHRWLWEYVYGQVPDSLELDHLCRNPRCVNPTHLEAVTARINNLRGIGPAAINAVKTHCPKGHEYNAENTYHMPSGRRACRTCMRRQVREWKVKVGLIKDRKALLMDEE